MPALDSSATMSHHSLYYYDQFSQAGLGRHCGLLHHHQPSLTPPPFDPRTEAAVPYYPQHQYPSNPHTQKLPVTQSWVERHLSARSPTSGRERSKTPLPNGRLVDQPTLPLSPSDRALPFDEHNYAECSSWACPSAQHLLGSPDSDWEIDPTLSLPHLPIYDRDGSFGSLSLSPLSDIDATPDLLPGDLYDDSEDDSPFLQSPLSVRSQACELPSCHVVEVDDNWITQSPSLSRRSDSPLPIDDSDDSLDFKDSSSSLFASEILHHSPGHSLLLFDDFDTPCPRSQSPASYDDELPYDFPSPPSFVPDNGESEVLQRFLDLRKRSQTAERVARTTEQQLLQEGVIEGREEARHRRKREKERCKEISALLRLKLDKAPPSPSASSIGSSSPESLALGSDSSLSAEEAVAMTASCSNAATTLVVPSCSPRLKSKDHKTVISSMDQLVARMVFRRREAAAPRQSRLYRHYGASPLGLSRHNQLSLPKTPDLEESLEELEPGVSEHGDDDDDDDLPQLRGFGFQ